MAGCRLTELAALDSQHTGNDVEINSAAGEGAGDFRHATGATIGQPLARIRLGVIERARRLEI